MKVKLIERLKYFIVIYENCIRLQKLDGLKYKNLKENIQKVITEIPKEKYENIFKGVYERPEKYVPRNITRKVKKNYK
jgi:hypothetical protein